ncbi:MAG: hypothetical protein LC775_19155 [Acidobacteria bacterium]|nr:hypothetical protein [Acidobacteriota bacterium]
MNERNLGETSANSIEALLLQNLGEDFLEGLEGSSVYLESNIIEVLVLVSRSAALVLTWLMDDGVLVNMVQRVMGHEHLYTWHP